MVMSFRAERAEVFQKAFFTEGREGNEETGVGSSQISKQTLFLHLMLEFQRLFAPYP
jgi:hypothetical protein